MAGAHPNPKSKRQQAFAWLDEHPSTTRPEAKLHISKLLDVSIVYANTLFQSHRTSRGGDSTKGTHEKIYLVKDLRSNKIVNPYMSELVKPNPGTEEHRTPEAAISAYVTNNQMKSELAKELC